MFGRQRVHAAGLAEALICSTCSAMRNAPELLLRHAVGTAGRVSKTGPPDLAQASVAAIRAASQQFNADTENASRFVVHMCKRADFTQNRRRNFPQIFNLLNKYDDT